MSFLLQNLCYTVLDYGLANVTWCIKNCTSWLQYVSEQWIVISDTCSAVNRAFSKSLTKRSYSLYACIEFLLSKTRSHPTSILCDLWPFKLHVYYMLTIRTQYIMEPTVGDIFVFISVFQRFSGYIFPSPQQRHIHRILMDSVSVRKYFGLLVTESP